MPKRPVLFALFFLSVGSLCIEAEPGVDTAAVASGANNDCYERWRKGRLVNIGYGYFRPGLDEANRYYDQLAGDRRGYSRFGNGGGWWVRIKLERENLLWSRAALWLSLESQYDGIEDSSGEYSTSLSNTNLLLSFVVPFRVAGTFYGLAGIGSGWGWLAQTSSGGYCDAPFCGFPSSHGTWPAVARAGVYWRLLEGMSLGLEAKYTYVHKILPQNGFYEWDLSGPTVGLGLIID